MKNSFKVAVGGAATALAAGLMAPGTAQAAAEIAIQLDSPVPFNSIYVSLRASDGTTFDGCFKNQRGHAGLTTTGLLAPPNSVVSVTLFTTSDCTFGVVFRTVRQAPIRSDGLFRFY